jgi:hypothetical protein
MPPKNRHKKSWIETIIRLARTQCNSPKRFLAWFDAAVGSSFTLLALGGLICMLLSVVLYAIFDNPKILWLNLVALVVFFLTRLGPNRPLAAHSSPQPPSRQPKAREPESRRPRRWVPAISVVSFIIMALGSLANEGNRRRMGRVLDALRSQDPPAPVVQKHARGRITVRPASEQAPAARLESEFSKREKFLEQRAAPAPPTAKRKPTSDERPRQKKPPARQKGAKPKAPQTVESGADGKAKSAGASPSAVSRD